MRGGSFGSAALLPGCELLGNQQRDIDVAFSAFKCQFLKGGILDKAFVKLFQGVEEKEEKEPPCPAGCGAARAVPGGSAGLVAMQDPALAHSHRE